MADRFEADPATLAATGRTIEAGAEEAAASFRAHRAALTSAASGLFTRSSSALSGKADVWGAAAAALAATAADHGTGMTTGAALFLRTDGANATGLGGHPGTLNL